MTDVGAYSPLDYSQVSYLRTPVTGRVTSRVNAEQWKVFVEPNVREASNLCMHALLYDLRLHFTQVLGRRVDPVSRRVDPTVTDLPLEPHSFNLTMEPVTPFLLAREEREREREAASAEKRRDNLKRPHERDEHESASEDGLTNGRRPEKRLKVLRPTVPASAPMTAAPASATTPLASSKQQQQAGPVAAKTKPDTALVRLSSGKIVRVPIEILRQHQAQIKARNQQPTSSSSLSSATAIATSTAAATTPLRNGISTQVKSVLVSSTTTTTTAATSSSATTTPSNQALSRVLARISPAGAVAASGGRSSAASPIFQQHQRPQVIVQRPATAAAASATTASVVRHQVRPSAPIAVARSSAPVSVVTNGIHLAQPRHAVAAAQQPQRVVRIRAYQGPGGAATALSAPSVVSAMQSGRAIAIQGTTANGAAKLSERLNLINPTAISSQPQQIRVVTSLGGVSVGGQPVRIRCYQGPGASSATAAAPVVATSTAAVAPDSSQRLSVALNSVTGQQRVVATSSPQKSVPVERVIVLGPKHSAQVQQHNGQILSLPVVGAQPQQQQQQRVQLAPIFARKAVHQAGAVSGQHQVAVAPAAGSSSVVRRSVKVVELVQQPGGKGGQLVALGGGQIVRATATTGAAGVQFVRTPEQQQQQVAIPNPPSSSSSSQP